MAKGEKQTLEDRIKTLEELISRMADHQLKLVERIPELERRLRTAQAQTMLAMDWIDKSAAAQAATALTLGRVQVVVLQLIRTDRDASSRAAKLWTTAGGAEIPSLEALKAQATVLAETCRRMAAEAEAREQGGKSLAMELARQLKAQLQQTPKSWAEAAVQELRRQRGADPSTN